jgi:hypothetical protein
MGEPNGGMGEAREANQLKQKGREVVIHKMIEKERSLL